jgi:hypothetical protein
MRGHPWHDVALNGDPADWFPVFVEIDRGSRVRYQPVTWGPKKLRPSGSV